MKTAGTDRSKEIFAVAAAEPLGQSRSRSHDAILQLRKLGARILAGSESCLAGNAMAPDIAGNVPTSNGILRRW